MQRHGPIIWVKLNWTSFDIYTRFYLSTSVSQTRAMEFFFYNSHIYRDRQMEKAYLHITDFALLME